MTIIYTPVMVFSRDEFSKLIMGNLWEAVELLEDSRKKLKSVSGYASDDSNYRFNNLYGDEFVFQLNQKAKWDKVLNKFNLMDSFKISVWGDKGQTALFDCVLAPLPDNRRTNLIQLFTAVDKFSEGFVMCSDCGAWMNYRENKSNRYFAGVYCKACWEGKWKAIEAKETYD